MAKKRKRTDSNDWVTPEEFSEAMQPEYPPEALSEETSAPQQGDEELPYTVGWWKGFRQWRCKQCPWDTLESEAAMLEHIATVHAPPKPRVYVADKSGREINL